MKLVFVWGLGVFSEDGCLVYLSPQASRNKLKPRWESRCYSLQLKSLSIEVFSTSGLEYAYDSFLWSLSPGSSQDVICPEEVIICPLQGGYFDTCVKWGPDAGPSKNRSRKRNTSRFLRSPSGIPVSSGQRQQSKKTNFQELRPFRDKGLGHHIYEEDHPAELQAVSG